MAPFVGSILIDLSSGNEEGHDLHFFSLLTRTAECGNLVASCWCEMMYIHLMAFWHDRTGHELCSYYILILFSVQCY